MSLNFSTQLRRNMAYAIDSTETFNTLANFQSYAASLNSNAAYEGQICKVVITTEGFESTKHYIIDSNHTGNYRELNTFENLIDSPGKYSGNADKVIKVNSSGDGLIFSDTVEGTTNLAIGNRSSTILEITNSTGDNVDVPLATNTLTGLMSPNHFEKISNLDLINNAQYNSLTVEDCLDSNTKISMKNGALELTNGSVIWKMFIDNDGDLILDKVL